MAFDLDDDELKATREMHKLSDKNVAHEEIMTKEAFDELIDNLEVVEKLTLYGRKAIKYHVKKMQQQIDEKDKKIQELEDYLKKYHNGELYTAKQLKQIEENQNKYFINKQKVKDVLQNNRNELFSTTYVDDIQYKPYTMQIDRINKIERELLEGE